MIVGMSWPALSRLLKCKLRKSSAQLSGQKTREFRSATLSGRQVLSIFAPYAICDVIAALRGRSKPRWVEFWRFSPKEHDEVDLVLHPLRREGWPWDAMGQYQIAAKLEGEHRNQPAIFLHFGDVNRRVPRFCPMSISFWQ